MKFVFILITFILAASCTTYVPVEYRTLGEFGVAKNTPIKISNAEKKDLAILLQKEIIKDGWWKYSTDDKTYYELTVTETNRTGSETSSSNEVRDGKTFRKSYYMANGYCTFTLKKNSDKDAKTFAVSASGQSESEKEMPKEHGKNSFWPVFNTLVGYDPAQEAISSQVMYSSMDAFQNLDLNLAREIIKKITPEQKIARVEFEDGKDDMDPVSKYIKAQDYQTAFNYLQGLKDKETRSDIQYNLGVVQEARQIYTDACTYFQKAYTLEAKSLYLEQKSECETRKSENLKLEQLI